MSNRLAQTGNDPAAPRFRLSYDLTFADYQALRQAKRALDPVDRIVWPWRYPLILGLAAGVGAFLAWSDGHAWSDLLSIDVLLAFAPFLAGSALFVFVVDILFEQVLPRWSFRRFALANRRLTLDIDQNALAWSSDGMSGSIPWSRVLRSIQIKDHFFLFISKIEAIGFPQRALGSPEEFTALVRYAREKVHG